MYNGILLFWLKLQNQLFGTGQFWEEIKSILDASFFSVSICSNSFLISQYFHLHRLLCFFTFSQLKKWRFQIVFVQNFLNNLSRPFLTASIKTKNLFLLQGFKTNNCLSYSTQEKKDDYLESDWIEILIDFLVRYVVNDSFKALIYLTD